MIFVWIVIAIVVVLALWVVGVYNGLIRLRNRTKEAWSDIDVQLKRRHDLIPNLIETVKGYASHEAQVFQNVTEARAKAISAQESGNIAEAGKSENMLSGALKSLFAVAESYPELKANQNFLELQRELADTEDKIQAARRFYNGNVRDFNTKLEVFPNSVLAGMFSFKSFEFFQVESEEEKAVPKVDFSATK